MSIARTIPRRAWLGAAAATFAAGCGQGAPSSAAATPGPAVRRKFGFVVQTMNNPFFIELEAGLRGVLAKADADLVTLDSAFDAAKQRNDLADLLLQGVAGLFVNPVDWEGIRTSLVEAQRKKVPVVVVDAPVKDADLVVCQVASDNVEAGRLAARALAAKQPNAQIAVLDLPTNKACLDRVQGFTEELAKHAGMKVLETQNGQGKAEAALPVLRDLLAKRPELTAAFPINDPSALGCAAAVAAAGRTKGFDIVSVDGSAEAAEAIGAGKLLATAAQFPREIGATAAERMLERLAGKTVPKEVKVRVELVNAANAAAFRRKP